MIVQARYYVVRPPRYAATPVWTTDVEVPDGLQDVKDLEALIARRLTPPAESRHVDVVDWRPLRPDEPVCVGTSWRSLY